jgi:histidinol phosphatase-like PHP family hydrolase
MYDLHIHSLLSDGLLLPSEIAVRYAAFGYKAIAITDHVDYSNIEQVIASILKFSRHWPEGAPVKVITGVELTHLPLNQFKPLARYARSKGIRIIVAHGQTVSEPVIAGTNRAALESDIDILAHPGLITQEEAKLAVDKGVFLEITCRQAHKAGNPYVIKMARAKKAKLILNTDSHSPEDIITPQDLQDIALNAGLSPKEIDKIYKDVGKVILND